MEKGKEHIEKWADKYIKLAIRDTDLEVVGFAGKGRRDKYVDKNTGDIYYINGLDDGSGVRWLEVNSSGNIPESKKYYAIMNNYGSDDHFLEMIFDVADSSFRVMDCVYHNYISITLNGDKKEKVRGFVTRNENRLFYHENSGEKEELPEVSVGIIVSKIQEAFQRAIPSSTDRDYIEEHASKLFEQFKPIFELSVQDAFFKAWREQILSVATDDRKRLMRLDIEFEDAYSKYLEERAALIYGISKQEEKANNLLSSFSKETEEQSIIQK